MIRRLVPQRFATRLLRDQRGLALTEFAMSLPVLMMMGLGGVELANYALALERVNQIAMTVADNAGRVRESIDEVDINEVMAGAKFVGQRIDFASRGRVILSSVEMNAAGTGQWIRWQRCAGAKNVTSSYGLQDAGKTDATLQSIGPVGNKIAASAGTTLMFVEVVYDYKPIIPVTFLGYTNRTLRSTAAFAVRQRTDQVLKNVSSLVGAALSSCTLFGA